MRLSRRVLLNGSAGAIMSAFGAKSPGVRVNRKDSLLVGNYFQPAGLDGISPAGDLLRRSEMLFGRLQDPLFHFEFLSKMSMPDAPGDALGRAILALTLLSRLLNQRSPFLNEIVSHLPERLNVQGYIGDVTPAGFANESQLAGHNGLLRGLCEYYLWTNDGQIRTIIDRITTNLVSPAQNCFPDYPLLPSAARRNRDLVIGAPVDAQGKWKGLSSDVGQVFMVLDGATQAYEISKSSELASAIEAIVARFAQIDPVAAGVQTHGMLTAVRGILRFFELTGSVPFLKLAEARFRLYKAQAMTANFANYNWFGRPEWTEPCAVIDSFTIACWLFRLTGNPEWLHDAHLIYYNGLLAGQRPNGGFGCDLCAGARGRLSLAPFAKYFEAYWCCTMRGGEGLACAAQNNFLVRGDVVVMPFFHEGTWDLRFTNDTCRIRVSSSYPFEGDVRIVVLEARSSVQKRLRIFTPSWIAADSLRVFVSGRQQSTAIQDSFIEIVTRMEAGTSINLQFELASRSFPSISQPKMPSYVSYFRGPVLLSHDGKSPAVQKSHAPMLPLGEGRVLNPETGALLEPLSNLTYLSEVAAEHSDRQILFPAS